MNRIAVNIYVFLLIFSFGFVKNNYCAEIDSAKMQTQNYKQSGLIIGRLTDYFPTKPGIVLSYNIKIGEVEPLAYAEVFWPNESAPIITRGRFLPLVRELSEKYFFLSLKIKGAAKKQGQLQYPIGVEFSVEKDDLGIYRGAKQVFWAANDQDRFVWREVVSFFPAKSGFFSKEDQYQRDALDAELGYSSRMLFFQKKPGTQIAENNKSSEKLFFKGIKPVPGLSVNGLYFVRVVEPDPNTDAAEDYLNRRFEDHSYFVRGKGLVYLEQKIGGKTSMTWRIADSVK